jgi:protein LSM14
VKSSPQLQPPTLLQPPTDPAIISLQSQSQYLPPSPLGPYVGGIPSAGSSSEVNGPPPPYSGLPPAYRGGIPSLYPSPGSWGPPPPPPPGPNGTGLATPMYWQGYYRPTAHLQQQQHIPPQPPLSLAPPPPTQPQPLHIHQQLQPVTRPSGPVNVFPAAPATSVAQAQAPRSVSGISVSVSAAADIPPTIPTAPGALRAPVVAAAQAALATSVGSAALAAPTVLAAPAALATPAALAAPTTTVATPAALAAPTTTVAAVAALVTVPASQAPVLSATAMSLVGTTAAPSTSAPVLSVPLSAATSLPSSLQGGVSAVITPAAKNPRRIVGSVYQSAQPLPQHTMGNSSTQSPGMTSLPSTAAAVKSQTATTQLPGVLAAPSKAPSSTSQQAPLMSEQKSDEPVKLADQSLTSAAQPPQQQQVTQPLLPLPPSQQKQPPFQRRGGHGVPVGQRNRWQGNGATGNNNHTRRGRGRGSGSGRGIGLTHPTQHFTEDFDFTAMNEKFNKDEVWGELGGKGEKGGDEEDEYGDGNLDDDTSDVAFLTKSLSDAPKKAMYVKDDFFDSLSCDALDREEGRSERNRFSEQRKIDTEVVQELCVLCFLFHVQHSVYWLGVP